MRRIMIIALVVMLAATAKGADRPFAEIFDRAELGVFDLDLAAVGGKFAPAERALIEALYALGRLDTEAAEAALKRYSALADGDLERRRQYYSLSEDLHFLQARYQQAAADGAAWMQLPGANSQESYQSSQQTLGIARMLASVAPEKVPGGVVASTVPLSRDKIGLSRIRIGIEGQLQEAVVDTGASFSVLSASTAKRLGLKPLQGLAALGSSVSAEISSRIAVAHHVRVGSTRFESVIFLVLDDEQLTFPVPGGFSIPAILGFPELHRLGRLRFNDQSMRVGSAAASGPSNLVATGSKLYVATDVAGSCVPLHLDTGANASELTGLYAEEHPENIQALETRERRQGGAGGVSSDQVLNWAGPVFKVGDRQVTLPGLDVSLSKQMVHPLRYGTVGRDVLARGYELDFIDMRLSIDGDPLASANACLPLH